jgi:hypothetical protein
MLEEYENIQEAYLPRWEGSGDIYLIRPLAHVGPSWAMLYLAKSRPIKTIRASASARCNKVRLCWRIHALGFPSFIAFFFILVSDSVTREIDFRNCPVVAVLFPFSLLVHLLIHFLDLSLLRHFHPVFVKITVVLVLPCSRCCSFSFVP